MKTVGRLRNELNLKPQIKYDSGTHRHMQKVVIFIKKSILFTWIVKKLICKEEDELNF